MASVWIRSYQIKKFLDSTRYHIDVNRTKPIPDVAIFLRRYGSEDILLAKELKSNGCHIIVDVVANYFESRQGDLYGVGTSTNEMVESLIQLISIADQVWTVSPFLKKVASTYCDRVYFVSDSIDPHHISYRHLPKFKRPIILGWSGIYSKANVLESISTVLKPLIAKGDVQVNIISNRKPGLSFPYKFIKWNYRNFPSQIMGCDLGIAPRIVDNNYDRGHSIYKIAAFMAAGRPVLAGPVPSYDLLLGDSVAGRICMSTQEWNSYLCGFIDGSIDFISMSEAAVQKIAPYTSQMVADQISRLFSELLSQPDEK
jgi:hypothetical protein